MSVEIFLIVALFLTICLLAGAFVWLHLKSKDQVSLQMQDIARQIIEAQTKDQSMQLLQQQIGTLRDQLSKNLSESAKMMMDSQKTVGDRLDRAAEVVGNVQKALGALDSSTKQVYEVGKNIAQLEEILRAPKARGAFGELFLGELLAQILPPQHFKLQHAFRSGEIVDAVVKLGHLVSVDAKFPLENFKRLIQTQNLQEKTQARRKFIQDVKKHIDAIASKYILPDEGTFEFALMYIPVENVYYEMIVKDETIAEESSIMTYAFSKRVMPVSPNSFYTYLHTISLGLRGLQIEENARIIMDQLSRLRGDFGKFKDDFAQLGKHLSHSRGKYEEAERKLERFGDKLIQTGGKEAEEIAEVAADASSYLPLK